MKACKNCEHYCTNIFGEPGCEHPKMMTDHRIYGQQPRPLDKAATDKCDEHIYFTRKQPPRGWFWWMCP